MGRVHCMTRSMLMRCCASRMAEIMGYAMAASCWMDIVPDNLAAPAALWGSSATRRLRRVEWTSFPTICIILPADQSEKKFGCRDCAAQSIHIPYAFSLAALHIYTLSMVWFFYLFICKSVCKSVCLCLSVCLSLSQSGTLV